jgi:predicted transcriptional regulator
MKISAAESRILDVLWRLGPSDAVEILNALADSEGWSDPTIRTLLRRLIVKKAVVKKKEGKRPVYRALVKQADIAKAESVTLIDRFYDGRISPLVLQFARHRKLDKQDLAELKRLVAELDNDK